MIAFDIDGVLADYLSAFLAYLRTKGIMLSKKDFTNFRFHEILGCSKKEAAAYVKEAENSGILLELEPFNG